MVMWEKRYQVPESNQKRDSWSQKKLLKLQHRHVYISKMVIFSFKNSIFAQNWLTNISEKGYKNKIDDENTGRYQTSDIRGHPASGHLKTDDSDSSNDGDDDKYVVYGYAKNEKTGSGNEDNESDSKDQENDKECMNYLQTYAVGKYQLENSDFFFRGFRKKSKLGNNQQLIIVR